ncbi:MAG: M20/M25/M40 family metallo-hydrolase, partial [Bacilli bacterium]
SVNIELEDKGNKIIVLLTVRGLKGGHSGIEIHKERGNSNKIMGRILKDLSSKVDFNMQSINGGSKNNAIPREMDTVIAIKNSDLEKVKTIVSNWQDLLLNELKTQDPEIKVSFEEIEDSAKKVFTKECTKKVVDLLYLYPNGINTRSVEIEGLVESSINLGVVTTLEDVVEFDSAIRSSVASLKEEITLKAKTITKLVGAEFETTAGYPEWQYNSNSKLRDICQRVHGEIYGKEAEIVAIHAGVECGLFNEKLGGLDMISFGPNLYDVHTPKEHMSISSVESIWKYLKAVLKELK